MLGIVVSRADEASVHIGERLRELADWTAHEDDERAGADGGGTVYRTAGAELREFDALHIDLSRPAAAFDDPDLVAFASRHSGETGPLLTAHHTGNVGPARFGGTPNTMAQAAPAALAAVIDAFDGFAPDGYDVGIECTHHGPTDVGAPSLFVEVGSDEAQWRDGAAATAAARAILALREIDPRTERAVVGVGGGHYAPRFLRIVRETDWAVGHVAADWGLRAAGEVTDDLLGQLFERSGAQIAVIDGDHPTLADRIVDAGYRVVGESFLRETTGVSLDLVERLEGELRPVDDGLRFGEAAREDGPIGDRIEPDPDLLAAVNGIDGERVRSTVASGAIAYETVESGHRVEGIVVTPDVDAWERIEAELVELLRERYDVVTVEEEAIIVTEQAFDPTRARDLGVEPGPAFGRLAEGEVVTVGDDEIRPEAVHEPRTMRFRR